MALCFQTGRQQDFVCLELLASTAHRSSLREDASCNASAPSRVRRASLVAAACASVSSRCNLLTSTTRRARSFIQSSSRTAATLWIHSLLYQCSGQHNGKTHAVLPCVILACYLLPYLLHKRNTQHAFLQAISPRHVPTRSYTTFFETSAYAGRLLALKRDDNILHLLA